MLNETVDPSVVGPVCPVDPVAMVGVLLRSVVQSGRPFVVAIVLPNVVLPIVVLPFVVEGLVFVVVPSVVVSVLLVVPVVSLTSSLSSSFSSSSSLV